MEKLAEFLQVLRQVIYQVVPQFDAIFWGMCVIGCVFLLIMVVFGAGRESGDI